MLEGQKRRRLREHWRHRHRPKRAPYCETTGTSTFKQYLQPVIKPTASGSGSQWQSVAGNTDSRSPPRTTLPFSNRAGRGQLGKMAELSGGAKINNQIDSFLGEQKCTSHEVWSGPVNSILQNPGRSLIGPQSKREKLSRISTVETEGPG